MKIVSQMFRVQKKDNFNSTSDSYEERGNIFILRGLIKCCLIWVYITDVNWHNRFIQNIEITIRIAYLCLKSPRRTLFKILWFYNKLLQSFLLSSRSKSTMAILVYNKIKTSFNKYNFHFKNIYIFICILFISFNFINGGETIS